MASSEESVMGMGKAGLLACAIVLSSMGCYGRSSPKTCHAKYVRDGRGGPGSYDRCMAEYERRERIREERRLGLRPSRAETALVIAGAFAGAQTTTEPRWICTDGWVSGCRADRPANSGCCSWHGGMTRSYVYVTR